MINTNHSMSLNNLCRVGVVGAGYWGKNLIRILYELEALQIICDTDSALLEKYKTIYPAIQTTTDIGVIFNNSSLQGVVIATPAVTHYQLVSDALTAGKDVFVEKPLSLAVRDGENLVLLAREQKKILMVGHLLHYHPAVVALKKLIINGSLGEIQYISSHRLNFGKLRKEENVLWSFAPHDISIIISILGEPTAQQSFGKSYIRKGAPDITLSLLQFPNNTAAHIFVSWLHPIKEQRLCIIGTKGMAVFDDQAQNKLLFYPHAISFDDKNTPYTIKAREEPVTYLDQEPLSQEMVHFLYCISTRQTPITDGEEGLRVLRVLQACQHSLDNSENSFATII